MQTEKYGILLINTGSPDAPETAPVREYLNRFLSDPRIIDIAAWKRKLLVKLILLTRPKESAHAYSQIWTDRGSPLVFHAEDLRDGLRKQLPDALIEIGMAYGRPYVPAALKSLIKQGATRIVLAPLFPQYASATVGSVLELSYKTLAELPNVPPITTVRPFYDHPAYLNAWATLAKPYLDAFKPDHILMSYHGLPERQIEKCDPSGTHCLKSDSCCDNFRDGNPNCYRAHCAESTRGIVERMGLTEDDYTFVFQSKLGRDPWLTPAMDTTVVEMAKKGVKRLAILSPAFVADCIETIEEVGMQARDSFLENGGEAFELVPSLNSEEVWIEAFAQILKETMPGTN
jgi:protoporphyrin/coproporphyrin ferrochelatase